MQNIKLFLFITSKYTLQLLTLMLVHKKKSKNAQTFKKEDKDNSLITSYFKSFLTKTINYLLGFLYCVDPITDF